MLDVISIGSATEDVFVYLPKEFMAGDSCVLYPGTKIEIEGMRYFTGGGAINTSVAFGRLGFRAGIMCAIGEDDAAESILKELKKENVDCRNALRIRGRNTAYSVILTGPGKDRIILHYGGTTAMLGHAKIGWKKIKAKWVYLSSLHADEDVLWGVAGHAKKTGAKIAFNPGQKELGLGLEKLEGIFGHIDVLLLNNEEALKLTGSVDIHRNLRRLSQFADYAAITEGKHGAHATDGKAIYSMKPYAVKVVDVTGAGDAFGSGFTAAIMRGKGCAEAVKWGTANASSEVMDFGTKSVLLSESGIKKFVAMHSKKENKVRAEEM